MRKRPPSSMPPRRFEAPGSKIIKPQIERKTQLVYTYIPKQDKPKEKQYSGEIICEPSYEIDEIDKTIIIKDLPIDKDQIEYKIISHKVIIKVPRFDVQYKAEIQIPQHWSVETVKQSFNNGVMVLDFATAKKQ